MSSHKMTKHIVLWGLSSSALLLALSILPAASAYAATSSPETLYVSSQGSNSSGNGTVTAPYATIQYALNLAPSGSTVIVEPGSYNESLSIVQPVILEAQSAVDSGVGPTTISGQNQSGLNTIFITGAAASGTVIDGFTITDGADHGILVQNANHVTVENNHVTGNGTAGIKGIEEDKPIELIGTSNGIVKDNTVENNLADGGIGVADDGTNDPGTPGATGGTMAPSKDNVVEDNTIEHNAGGCGVVIASYNAGEGVIDNTVVGNTASANVAGIVVATDAPNTVAEGNVIKNNTVQQNIISGIILHSNAPADTLNDNVVEGNTISNNGADGEVGDAQTTGIVEVGAVNPISGNSIINNTISDQQLGVYVIGALKNTVSGNTFNTTDTVLPALDLLNSAPIPGKTLTFTATNPTGTTNLMYQFWANSGTGWKLVQNYSSTSTYSIKDAPTASYQVVAYALTASQVKAQHWNDAISATTIVNDGSSVSLKSLSSTPSMLQASATGLTNPVYQYWWKSPSGTWSSSGNFSSNGTYNLFGSTTITAGEAGDYSVIVYAKDADAPDTTQDVVASQTLSLSLTANANVTLSSR